MATSLEPPEAKMYSALDWMRQQGRGIEFSRESGRVGGRGQGSGFRVGDSMTRKRFGDLTSHDVSEQCPRAVRQT
jgi:hypothetical protein